jgi:hypothetical protein
MDTSFELHDIPVQELMSPELREEAWKARLLDRQIRVVSVMTAGMPEVLQVLWLASSDEEVPSRAGFSWGGGERWTPARWINVETIEQAVTQYLST